MSVIIRLLLGTVIFWSLMPCLCFANQMPNLRAVEIKHLQQVCLELASDAINRINFDNFSVTKLIGNIGSFDSILSEQGSDLFIAPKLQVGKRIDFSAILASGDIIDFSLLVIKSETPTLVKLKFPAGKAGETKSEASKMIEAMHKRKTGKYYVRKSLEVINLPLVPNIKAVAQDSYRFKNLHGTSLVLENLSRFDSVEITASDLAKSFDSVAAIDTDQALLPPKGKTKAWIVFKGGSE